ncbi:MAG: hemophore-related protein [Mycobacterium sp.]
MSMMRRLALCSGGAMVALAASSGIAAAQPDVEAIVNSSCSYPQVMAALNAQSPTASGQLTSSPVAVSWLQQLVASPPDGRRAMIAQIQAYPALASYTPLINQVAASCSNY